MHILKMKNILYEIKNTLDEFSRQDTTNTELVNLMSQQKLFKSRHKEKKIKEEKDALQINLKNLKCINLGKSMAAGNSNCLKVGKKKTTLGLVRAFIDLPLCAPSKAF